MILCLVLGLRAILRRDVPTHRAWMIRAYALGLGAGTQVVTIGLGQAAPRHQHGRHRRRHRRRMGDQPRLAELIIRLPRAPLRAPTSLSTQQPRHTLTRRIPDDHR